ncbi:MAG: hypothetical protein ABSD96_17695 [Candidatus Korobacteraceae bacterium]|jgi:hypothetical protein
MEIGAGERYRYAWPASRARGIWQQTVAFASATEEKEVGVSTISMPPRVHFQGKAENSLSLKVKECTIAEHWDKIKSWFYERCLLVRESERIALPMLHK